MSLLFLNAAYLVFLLSFGHLRNPCAKYVECSKVVATWILAGFSNSHAVNDITRAEWKNNI